MGNLNLLSTEKMLALTQIWTVDHRPALAAAPQTAGLLVSLDAVFTRLSASAKRAPVATSAKEVYKIQRDTDQIHDHLLRGNFFLFTALAHYAAANNNHAEAQALLSLRDQLYPDGLSGTTLSFEEEAGAAKILEDQLTDAIRATLKSIVVSPNGNLLEKVVAQIEHAKKLRVLEQQKKTAQQFDATTDHADNEERKTRYDWIDTVRTLERSLRLARKNQNISAEIEAKLLSGLREAQKSAAQKLKEEKANAPDPIVPPVA